MDRGAWWATIHGIIESDTTELLSTREIIAFDFRMLPQTPQSFGDYTVHSIYTLLLF